MSERLVSVDFIGDVICPWCHVGWRSLHKVADLRPNLAFAVTWRPYLLNPETPKGGVDRRAFYAARAASDPDRRCVRIERRAGAHLRPQDRLDGRRHA
jgi:predicted DsbA family dithiol-disulfide isomerase